MKVYKISTYKYQIIYTGEVTMGPNPNTYDDDEYEEYVDTDKMI